MEADNELFTLDEISTYLKLTKGTVYKLCQARKLPYFKAGRQIRFSKKSIDKWIANRERSERNKKRRKRDGS
jgi:putative molybdopterin biosynthesis protein